MRTLCGGYKIFLNPWQNQAGGRGGRLVLVCNRFSIHYETKEKQFSSIRLKDKQDRTYKKRIFLVKINSPLQLVFAMFYYVEIEKKTCNFAPYRRLLGQI